MDLLTVALAKSLANQYTDEKVAEIQSYHSHICSSSEYSNLTGVPTISSPDETTFYFTPDISGEDIFHIYVYQNNAWSLFGSCNLDPDDFKVNWSEIIDKPSIDSTPTANSTNLVTSGGVAASLTSLSGDLSEIEDALSLVNVGYLLPIKTFTTRRTRVYNDNLYLSETTYCKTSVYKLKANNTYQCSLFAGTGALTCCATSRALIDSVSGGNQLVGAVISDVTKETTGTFSENITPTVDCYLYLQMPIDDTGANEKVYGNVYSIFNAQDTFDNVTELETNVSEITEFIDSIKTDTEHISFIKLSPLAVFEGRRLYPYNNVLYLSENSYNNVAVFEVEKDLIHYARCNSVNGAETILVLSSKLKTTGSGTNINIGSYITAETDSTHQEVVKSVTPNSKCYMYVQIPIEDTTADKVAVQESEINTISDHAGLCYDGITYTHFTQVRDGLFLCRDFARVYTNNLLQLYKMYYGVLAEDYIFPIKNICTSESDLVGPVSITNVYGTPNEWTGGVHGKTINNVMYPTAKQESLSVLCGGQEINTNGIYYGKVRIKSVNILYFPQLIVGNGLPDAAKAIKETREYRLDEHMDVNVRLEMLSNVYIGVYYGCQIFPPINVQALLLPNDQKMLNMSSSLSSPYSDTQKEHRIVFYTSDDEKYEISLDDVGAGMFTGNTVESKYIYVNQSNKKTYYVMIETNTEQDAGYESGKIIYWSGTYKFFTN